MSSDCISGSTEAKSFSEYFIARRLVIPPQACSQKPRNDTVRRQLHLCVNFSLGVVLAMNFGTKIYQWSLSGFDWQTHVQGPDLQVLR